MTARLDKDDPQLQPRPCGHIHYLRRAMLTALGADLDDHEARQAAGEEKTFLDLREVWPVDKEYMDSVYDDSEVLTRAHVDNHDQGVEAMDDHMKFLALLRLADGVKGDPKLEPLARLLTIDALLAHLSANARKEQLSKLLGGLFENGLPQLPTSDDVPPPGKKH